MTCHLRDGQIPTHAPIDSMERRGGQPGEAACHAEQRARRPCVVGGTCKGGVSSEQAESCSQEADEGQAERGQTGVEGERVCQHCD